MAAERAADMYAEYRGLVMKRFGPGLTRRDRSRLRYVCRKLDGIEMRELAPGLLRLEQQCQQAERLALLVGGLHVRAT